MSKKTIIILLGLLIGLLCLGVVAAKNPRLREVLASGDAEADRSYGHPHPHATAQDAHGHTHEDDGHAHPHPHPPADATAAPPATDEHDHEPGVVHLDARRMAELGIELATVGSGQVKDSVSLPGEIKFNTDRVAHIVPQISGIARSVRKNVGDRVAAGEVIAWLESAKLGETKVQYLARLAEVRCWAMELARAQEVHDNTMRLLAALESSPSLEVLRDSGGAPMGKNLSQLVSAYAEWVLARTTYAREKALYEKQITSQGEFLRAENALKKTEAVYNATRDSLAYDVQRDLLEAQQVQRVGRIELTSAERSLYVLGLTAVDLHELERMEQQGREAEECDDPNCPHCHQPAQKARAAAPAETGCACGVPDCQGCDDHAAAGAGAGPPQTGGCEQRLAWYPVRAPFAGTVIGKHLSTGEFIKDDSELFVIANLDTVWVDFQVHQKDLPSVKQGQVMEIRVGSGPSAVMGKIAYVSPIVDVATRTAWARIVLPNSHHRFRPGLFVTGTLVVDTAQAPIAVSRSAVQYVDDKPCVFVYGNEHFEKRDIVLGRADRDRVEIISGLKRGEIVAADGSFHIKAEIERQLSGGGGHGHMH